MQIPLYIFLIPFSLLLGIAFVVTAIHLYHIVRFGTPSITHRVLIGSYILCATLILTATILYLLPFKWTDTFDLGFSIELGA